MVAVPMQIREGLLCHGRDEAQTAFKVIIPSAFSGIAPHSSSYLEGDRETMVVALQRAGCRSHGKPA